jgi:hypothetical protein
MPIAIIVLLGVALAVTLSVVRPSASSVLPPAPADRDRERLLADLRALPAYRYDVRLH